MSGGIALQFPDELVEAIAQRVAELLRSDEPAASDDPLLTVDEATAYLRATSRQRIYDLVNAQRIDVERDGRRLLIRRSALDRHLRGDAS